MKNIMFIVILLNLACSGGATDEPSSDDKAKEYLSKAKYELNQFQLQLAGQYLENVINLGSTAYLMDAYNALAFVNMKLNKHGEAIKIYEKSLLLFPGNTDARAGLSVLNYAYLRNFLKSADLANKVLLEEPEYKYWIYSKFNYQDIYLHLAMSQFASKDYDNAYITLKKYHNLNFTKADLIALSDFLSDLSRLYRSKF